MIGGDFGQIFPVVRYVARLNPAAYDQLVIVNWLEIQIPTRFENLDMLAAICGWRNREVFEYVRSYDWTLCMFEPGQIIEHEYLHPSNPARFRQLSGGRNAIGIPKIKAPKFWYWPE